MQRAAVIVLVLGVVGLFAMPFRIAGEQVQPLPAIGTANGLTGNGVFPADAVFASDRYEERPRTLAVRGSWPSNDQFQGTHETGWFRAAPKISIMVSGYPMQTGNRLELDVRNLDGSHVHLPYRVHDVGEQWMRWTVTLPAGAEAVRIIAVDGASTHGGWLGFSEPFTSTPIVAGQLWGLFQLLTATCLALVVIYGPGLIWFSERPRSLASLAFAMLPGPLLLAGIGFACWLAGGRVSVQAIARSGVGLMACWIGWRTIRTRPLSKIPPEARAVIAAGALLSGFAVAKANVSFGPAGELFGRRISRTLEVGNHSDSQISFHMVQVIAHHLGPYHDQTKLYYAPWRLGSRGPLGGMLAAPLVFTSGAQVPFYHPTHPWRPFDREGFAVYRIACIVVASLASWAVFGLVAAIASVAWAGFAGTMALLAPFFVHEMYFSWPKLIAGALVLVAFLALRNGRHFTAGVVLAVGYLFHPVAALSGPFLLAWVLSTPDVRGKWHRGAASAKFALGVLTLVLPWQVVGRFCPDENANQDVFAAYFFFADNAHATWSSWWRTRWENFANTFLPGYLLTFDRTHESLNSAYGPSDRWVQASFLYWNTLPFALGLPAFALAVMAVTRAARREPLVITTVLFAPALLLIAYWGSASTGLMRQCGHWLFLATIAVSTWSLARWPGGWSRRAAAMLLHPGCFAWRGLEIAMMAFGCTVLNERPDLDGLFGWNDVLSLVVAGACLTAAVIKLAKTARLLRSELFAATAVSLS